jgi:hypothetical protein
VSLAGREASRWSKERHGAALREEMCMCGVDYGVRESLGLFCKMSTLTLFSDRREYKITKSKPIETYHIKSIKSISLYETNYVFVFHLFDI